MNRERVLAAAVLANLLAGVVHGTAHALLPVAVPVWQYAVAAVTVCVLPLAGLVAVSTGRRRGGVALVALGGVAALSFEGLAHFGAVNPDHVSTVGDGSALFAGTALATTLGDLLLVATAGWFVVTYRQGRARSLSESST